LLEGKIRINLSPESWTGTLDLKLKIKYEKDFKEFPIKLKSCTDNILEEPEWEYCRQITFKNEDLPIDIIDALSLLNFL
jgi:hypothetical protein